MAVTAYASGQFRAENVPGIASSDPVPSFNRPPRIEPAGGAPGVSLTVKDGDVQNGAITARQWFRDEIPIDKATGATIVAAIAGSYSVASTVRGPGGVASETSPQARVAAREQIGLRITDSLFSGELVIDSLFGRDVLTDLVVS